MQISDVIAFASLFVSILTALIIPFVERPMLGYESITKSTINGNMTQYYLKIRNMGLVKLTNIIGSLSLPFKNLSSFPYVTNDTLTHNYTKNYTFFKITVLPPQATFSVILQPEKARSQEVPIVNYLASEEWMGYLAWKIIVINLLAIVIGITLSYFAFTLIRKY